jgi:hypothetical protein
LKFGFNKAAEICHLLFTLADFDAALTGTISLPSANICPFIGSSSSSFVAPGSRTFLFWLYRLKCVWIGGNCGLLR